MESVGSKHTCMYECNDDLKRRDLRFVREWVHWGVDEGKGDMEMM